MRMHTHVNAQHTLTRLTSQNSTTALMVAAQFNAIDVAKLLMDKGSDVNATDKVWYFAAVVSHELHLHHQWCE